MIPVRAKGHCQGFEAQTASQNVALATTSKQAFLYGTGDACGGSGHASDRAAHSATQLTRLDARGMTARTRQTIH